MKKRVKIYDIPQEYLFFYRNNTSEDRSERDNAKSFINAIKGEWDKERVTKVEVKRSKVEPKQDRVLSSSLRAERDDMFEFQTKEEKERSDRLALLETQETKDDTQEKVVDISTRNEVPNKAFERVSSIYLSEVSFKISREEIIAIANKIIEILNNPLIALSLLKDLDLELQKRLEKEKIKIAPNYPKFLIPSQGFYMSGPWPEGYRPAKKHKLLSKILFEREQASGDKKKSVPKFSGFVKPDEADSFLQNEGLFSEFSRSSTLLLHGKEIHRLHFEILKQAQARDMLPKVDGKNLTQEQLIEILLKTITRVNKGGGYFLDVKLWDFIIDVPSHILTDIDPERHWVELFDQKEYIYI